LAARAPISAADAAAPQPGPILLLSWAHFLNDGAANYLPGVLPAVLVALGLPVGYAGVLMGVLIAGQALQPVVGALADRHGGRVLLVGGLGAATLAAASVGVAPNLAWLLVALAFTGLGNACFHPPAMAGARRLARGTGERALSVFSVGGELGRGLWPLVASLLVAARGLSALWLLALPGVLTLPSLWRRASAPPRRAEPVAAFGEMRRAGGSLAALVGYSALRSVLIIAVTTFVPLLWQARGGSLVGGAGLITVMLVVGVGGNYGGALLAARAGRRRVVAGASAAACLLLVAFLRSTGLAAWLAIAGFGVAAFATLPLTIVMGQDLLPRATSLASGLALGFANSLGALGVAVLGLGAAHWGARGELWAAEFAGLCALALAFALPAASPAPPLPGGASR